jgi:uncharacterized protein YceK
MKPVSIALCLLVALNLSGCKIVKTIADGESTAAMAGEAGDEARIAALLDRS